MAAKHHCCGVLMHNYNVFEGGVCVCVCVCVCVYVCVCMFV